MEEQECFPEKNRDEDLLEKILEEENRRILYQAIRRLEVKKREVIQMQYFGGMSQKEIAAVLHITPENVRVLAYRGKERIKERFGRVKKVNSQISEKRKDSTRYVCRI